MSDLSVPANRAAASASHHGKINDTWPLHKREFARLGVAYVVLAAIWIGFGKLLEGPLSDSAVVRADERVAEWFAERRTGTWNTLTVWGSGLAETWVKVLVTSVVVIVLLRVWRRWFEAILIAVALILEAMLFITITLVVGRDRPGVPHLDSSPVGSSFPSGHVAAAVAYAAMAYVLFRHTRNRFARFVSVVVCVVVPVLVGLSRMYRGMHFLSDVIFGALLGAAAVIATIWILDRSPEAPPAFRPDGPHDLAGAPDAPAIGLQS